MLEESPEAISAETEEPSPQGPRQRSGSASSRDCGAFLSALPVERAADVLEYLNEDLRTEVLETMSARQAAELVTEMTSGRSAATRWKTSRRRAPRRFFPRFPTAERVETERLLAYEPDTAGGLMTTEFVSVSEDTPVDEALAAVRRIARSERREAMNAIYTTDSAGRVQGVMSLRDLLAHQRGRRYLTSRGRK